MRKNYKLLLILPLLLLCTYGTAVAKNKKEKKKDRTGSIWFSWGYNTEWYTRSTVHVTQGALGNDYDFVHVHANDHRGWDDGIFNKQLSIPQYNYRLGYYFNKEQDMGFEINFDHTKYLITD